MLTSIGSGGVAINGERRQDRSEAAKLVASGWETTDSSLGNGWSAGSQSSLPSWIMGSSSLVLRSTARTIVRSSTPSGLEAVAGMIWRASGMLKRTVKEPSGRTWIGSPWRVTRGVGLGGAVDDQFGVELEVELAAGEAQSACAEAGQGQAVHGTTKTFLEEVAQIVGRAAGSGAAGLAIDAVGLFVDAGPGLVHHVAGARLGGGDDVRPGQHVEGAACGRDSRHRRGRSGADC